MQARQRQAYCAGKVAWREGRISGQVLQLYEELVRRVGANDYSWIGEETLATELNRSFSTIKRWMRQLIDAHLIRRERQFGHTSHTYIVAYESTTETKEAGVATATPASSAHRVRRTASKQRTSPRCQTMTSGSAAHGSDDEAALQATSHEPVERINEPTNDPSIGSDLVQDSIKNQHIKTMGGGKDCYEETPAILRLQEVGVSDSTVLSELQDQPVDRVEAAVRYAGRCRSMDDVRRPGLIVHLLRRGFGDQSNQRHHYRHAPSVQDTMAPAIAEGPRSGSDRVAVAGWEEVRTRLAKQMDHQEYATWIAQCELLLRDQDQVVLGTPNVFVRDEIEHRYRPLIEAVLQQVYGTPTTLCLAIGMA